MPRFYALLPGLLLAALLPLAARAQATFQPGYVVLPAGDTLRGEVQLLGELRNARQCRFRPAATAPATEYGPTQARAYGVPGQAEFVARPVPAADSGAAPQPLFAQALATGPATLFRCRDQPGRTRYFVAVGGGRLRELTERRVKTFANGLEAYQTRALYRDTLAAALTGCVVVRAQLPTLAFNQGALLRLVARYNECVGGPAPRRVATAAVHLSRSVEVVAGLQAGQLRFDASPFSNKFLADAPPLPGTTFTGGVELSQELPYTRRTFSLRVGLLYAHEQYEGSASGQLTTTALFTPFLNRYQLQADYLHLPVAVRYTWRRLPRLRPSLEAGLLYSRALRLSTSFSQSLSGGPPVDPGYFTRPGQFRYDNFGYVLGVGLSGQLGGSHWVGAQLRFQAAHGLSNYTSIAADIQYVSVLLSYTLNRP